MRTKNPQEARKWAEQWGCSAESRPERESLRNDPYAYWPEGWDEWLQDVCYLHAFAPGRQRIWEVIELLPDCGYARFKAPCAPRVDVELEANTAALQATFSPTYVGADGKPLSLASLETRNGVGGNDGWVQLNGLAKFKSLHVDRPDFALAVSAPIEIGSTNPETTFARLTENGMVARWPYRHEYVTVLAMRPEAMRSRAGKLDAWLSAVLGGAQ